MIFKKTHSIYKANDQYERQLHINDEKKHDIKKKKKKKAQYRSVIKTHNHNKIAVISEIPIYYCEI